MNKNTKAILQGLLIGLIGAAVFCLYGWWSFANAFQVIGSGSVAATSCESGTADINADAHPVTPSGTTTLNAGSSIGWSYTELSQSGTVYGFRTTIYQNYDATQLECRFDDDVDMTSEYMASGTVSIPTTGEYTIEFTTHPVVTTSTAYYVECSVDTNSVVFNRSDTIPTIGYIYGGSQWNNTTSLSRENDGELLLCD
jgi:hypothetical protein